MGIPSAIIERLGDEVEQRVEYEQRIARLQMEIDLCHLWMDAADIPRYDSDRRKAPKSLLQRLAIFCVRWLDDSNYYILRDNVDELIIEPSKNNIYLAPLQREIDNDRDEVSD